MSSESTNKGYAQSETGDMSPFLIVILTIVAMVAIGKGGNKRRMAGL